MANPLVVLISDVHYSLPTLELADAAMRQAIAKANKLDVPLVVAGDLHDTKANLRGECVNRMLDTFTLCKHDCYILRGNHDALNEKSKEHSLNFLRTHRPSNRRIIDAPYSVGPLTLKDGSLWFIPYYHDVEELRDQLSRIKSGSTLIMHQGLAGSNSGDYIQDKSALLPRDIGCFRVISGHYHTRQTIQIKGMAFPWSYIGNPYTLNYGEANDPPKGYQILMSDGSLEFVPTNLRKHIVINIKVGDLDHPDLWEYDYNPGDLLWVKVSGDRQYLNLSKSEIGRQMGIVEDFKLTLEPTDLNIKAPTKQLTQGELFDNLIDSIDTSPETKTRLKTTWKELYERQ